MPDRERWKKRKPQNRRRPPSQRANRIVSRELMADVRKGFRFFQHEMSAALGVAVPTVERLERGGGGQLHRLALIGLLHERAGEVPSATRLALLARLHQAGAAGGSSAESRAS